jgi:antitoxin (DNA-binding transcriptional repressor) of toxin-antitoxin stability system
LQAKYLIPISGKYASRGASPFQAEAKAAYSPAEMNRMGGRLRKWRYNPTMADHAIHISEEEAARDFAGLLARVRAGAEVVIESDARPVAIVRPASDEFRPRLLSESIALAKEHAEKLGYEPRMDPDFASDLEEIAKRRRPWNPPAWE